MVRTLKCGVNGNESDFLPNGWELTVLSGLQRQVKFRGEDRHALEAPGGAE